jgi:hypothetical protein
VIVDFTIAYRAAGQLLEDGEPDPKYPGAAALAANVDDFFGDSREWLPIIRSGRRSERVERRLIDLYFEKVLGDRFKYKASYPVRVDPSLPWRIRVAGPPRRKKRLSARLSCNLAGSSAWLILLREALRLPERTQTCPQDLSPSNERAAAHRRVAVASPMGPAVGARLQQPKQLSGVFFAMRLLVSAIGKVV